MNMKKRIGIAVGTVLVVGLLATSITKVNPGYVGVVYSMNGGIKDKMLSQGYHLVLPTHKVKEFTIGTEQGYLAKSEKEGSEDDDSFSIPTKDGKMITVDLEYAYSYIEEDVPKTFTRFKGQDGKSIEDTFIRGKLKAWIAEVSASYPVIDIYGEKRAELNKAMLDHMKPKFEEYGIRLETANISRIGLDDTTAKAIQERVNAQQELEKEKISKEKAQIEAEKELIEAKGQSDALIEKARGEFEANKLKSQSLTPEILQEMELEARKEHGWVTVNGGTPIVDTRE